MAKKRVLIAHPKVTAAGGGNAVAAWTLQALRDDFEVALATLQPIDCQALNRSWGTSLRPGDIDVRVAPPHYQTLLGNFPTAGALLSTSLTMRLARNIDARVKFDVVMSTQNEADFGRRGIQYVHHPWLYLPRPKDEMSWFHYIPGILWAYRRICQAISMGTNAGLARNLSLANSSFIAGRIRSVHHTGSVIVFPPVTTGFPNVPWDERRSAAVGVGRIHSCKRWDMAVAIVEEVRRRGHDFGLTLISHPDPDEPEYLQQIKVLAADRPWFRLRLDLSRDELAAEVASHRYGIHAMREEHFGIGPAEILCAGCVLFAHNSGGPIEIVGGEPRVLFDDVNDAAAKISRVLSDRGLESELREKAAGQSHLFSTEAFCRALREIVTDFVAEEHTATPNR